MAIVYHFLSYYYTCEPLLIYIHTFYLRAEASNLLPSFTS